MASLDNLIRYVRPGSSVAFWYLPIEGRPAQDASVLGPYALDLSAKAGYPGPFDAEGIPLLNYHGAVGVQRNPAAVAQFALGLHERWRCSGDGAARDRFLAQADWLARSLAARPSGVRAWEYAFTANASAYPVRIPWISALSQGQGISVLLRAHEATGSAVYLDAASAAFPAFTTPVEKDGLRSTLDGGVFFEEVPCDPPSHILDGFLFSLFGIHDYVVVTSDRSAKDLLQAALDTTEAVLPLFDAAFWSRGDLFRPWPPMLASPMYHRLHVLQLEALAALTGRAAFREYAGRWRGFLANPLYRAAAFAAKGAFKVFYY